VGEIAFRQAILQGLIAAGFVEAMLRAWRIRRAESRLGFWLLALACLFLVLPLFLVAVPFRSSDRFAAGWALFSGDRWHAVRLGGAGIDTLVFATLAAAGTLLFLRDVVPFVIAAVRNRGKDAAAHAAPAREIVALVGDLVRLVETGAPAVCVLRTEAPVLLVRGLLHQTLILSDGVLARLSGEELRAAIVHELAHVRFRDPLVGWALMAARLLMFWNPAVQLIARAIVQEMEHRADLMAARVTTGSTFAAALRMLASSPGEAGLKPPPAFEVAGQGSRPAEGARRGNPRGRVEMLAERLHHAHVAARVESVLAPQPALPFGRTRFALVGAALVALLFFVV
jgi:Zn-dependent protease with chaperone function